MPVEQDLFNPETGEFRELTKEEMEALRHTPFEGFTPQQMTIVLKQLVGAIGRPGVGQQGQLTTGSVRDANALATQILNQSLAAQSTPEGSPFTTADVFTALEPLGFRGPSATPRGASFRRHAPAKPGSVPRSRGPLLTGLSRRPRGIPGDGTLLTTNASQENRLLGRPLLVGSG